MTNIRGVNYIKKSNSGSIVLLMWSAVCILHSVISSCIIEMQNTFVLSNCLCVMCAYSYTVITLD
jgi:hypothetical protein